ncbi:IS200/IS605 family transposase (plasmid) [Pontibacillus sp. ALD_SL1]|nr:IS200/IS605 family transposase [Pontibacillus sp. ALD_SL1]QST02645.1 IS200/IS605 family transposase [Pontibacillus sp. ALD_SL1]
MCMKTLTHARTCVYNVNYHLVWSVKYRRKVLDNRIETRLKEIFQAVANEKDFIVQKVEVGEQDHVHLFVSAHPKVAPSYMVKMLKGISGRKLFMEYPELKEKLWKGQLWNRSFYLETVGSISEETIKQYIDKQKKGG